jgi:hypothetical protein
MTAWMDGQHFGGDGSRIGALTNGEAASYFEGTWWFGAI